MNQKRNDKLTRKKVWHRPTIDLAQIANENMEDAKRIQKALQPIWHSDSHTLKKRQGLRSWLARKIHYISLRLLHLSSALSQHTTQATLPRQQRSEHTGKTTV